MMNKVRSKKGFSLPFAIGITTVLIVLASSLLFIAMSSLSETSSDVNSRQAYLNVRTALEVARNYYTNQYEVSNFPSLETNPEYLVFKDEGGTFSEGIKVTTDETVANAAVTYVKASYLSADTTGDDPQLELRAFSKYADAFGNKGKTYSLRIRFKLGASGMRHRWTTENIIVPNDPTTQSEYITLHVKKPDNFNWTLSYYIWTYRDAGGAYSSYSESSGDNSYTYKPNVTKLINTEQAGNRKFPAGIWEATNANGKQGPPAVAGASGGGDYTGSYDTITSITGASGATRKNVPYFNIIFAQKGSILNKFDSAGNSYIDHENSQLNEIFHLWYLDPDDKNIYFEFFDKGNATVKTYYHTGTGWNGKDGLEDTILVYVNNIKTTVHLIIEGSDYTSVTAPADAPTITSVTSSSLRPGTTSYTTGGTVQGGSVCSIPMTYEGCGWWVANIDSNSNMNMKVTYKGVEHSCIKVTAQKTTTKEAWVVLRESSPSMTSHTSERNALRDIGLAEDSYTTVHAKIADYKQSTAQPKLSYNESELASSTGRTKLLQKLIEASSLNEPDYTPTSWSNLASAVATGAEHYNDENFIVNQEGTTNAQKIAAANAAYDVDYNNINNAIIALVPNTITSDDYSTLNALIKKGDKVIQDQAASGKYDKEVFDIFNADDGVYRTVKGVLLTSLTTVQANTYITELQDALDAVEAGDITALRQELTTLIDNAESNYIGNNGYEEAYRNELRTIVNGGTLQDGTLYAGAKSVRDNKNIYRSAVEEARDKVSDGITACINHPASVLDMTELSALKTTASEWLETKTEDYTDASKANLQAAYDYANALHPTLQSEITEASQKLSDALKQFTVIKPMTANDRLVQGDRSNVRIWVIDNITAEHTYAMYCYPVGSTMPDIAAQSGFYNLHSAGYDNFSYFELKTTSFDRMEIAAMTIATEEVPDVITVKSEMIDVSDKAGTEIVFVISDNASDPANPFKVEQKQMTTLYYDCADSNNAIMTEATLTSGDKTITSFRETTANPVYYAARFITDSSTYKLTASYGSDSLGNQVTRVYENITVSPGQYVFVPNETDLTHQLVNVNDIYPKYLATSGSGSSYSVEPLANADNAEVTLVENASEDYTIENMTSYHTYTVDVSASMTSDQFCVMIDATAADNAFILDGTTVPYIYTWKGPSGSTTTIGADWPGTTMLRYTTPEGDATNFYYAIVSNEVEKLIVNNGNGKQSQNFEVSSASGSGQYVIVTCSGQTSGKYNISGTRSSTGPTVSIPEPDVTTFDSTVNMVYVGGKKVRITNKSYKDVYGDNNKANDIPNGQAVYFTNNHGWGEKYAYFYSTTGGEVDEPWPGKHMIYYKQNDSNQAVYAATIPAGANKVIFHNNAGYQIQFDAVAGRGYYDNGTWTVASDYLNDIKINSSNPYGGIGGNGQSENRVGMAELHPYYDWFEFKIPVAKGSKFTVEFEGMDASSASTKSTQVQHAYGDIWYEQLDNTTKTGGKYSKVNIYTFDPEQNQIIYAYDTNGNITNKIRVYFEKPTGWGDVTVSAYGTSGDMSQLMTNRLTDFDGAANYYSNYFYVDIDRNMPFITFTTTNDAGTTKIYRTCFQGGDKCLFKPRYNGGYGSWDTFVSPQTNLKREVEKLFNIYYGKKLITTYTDEGLAAEADYRYPEAIVSSSVIRNYLYENTNSTPHYFSLDTAKIYKMGDSAAYTSYRNLKDIRQNYDNLYVTMSKAKAYIKIPVSGGGAGKYSEYLNNADKLTEYTDVSLSNLRTALEGAEAYYCGSSVGDLSRGLSNLKRAIASLKVKEYNGVQVIFIDSQKRIADQHHNIKLQYATTPGGVPTVIELENENRYHQPTTTIEALQIYDVQFVDTNMVDAANPFGTPLGNPQNMKKGEHWVFLDYVTDPIWDKNTADGVDFIEIDQDCIVQDSISDVMAYYMTEITDAAGVGTGKFREMILYFVYDCKIKVNDTELYTIKAGAYDFKKSDVLPIKNLAAGSGNMPGINLFDDDAKTYFTTPENYGYFGDTLDAAGNVTMSAVDAVTDLGWYISAEHKFKTLSNITTDHNVNFEIRPDSSDKIGNFATNVSFYDYNTNGKMHFRWSCAEPLYTKAEVRLRASQFSFATAGGEINGSDYGGTKFLLYNTDTTKTSVDITFVTDVQVRYFDLAKGKEVYFVINEGTYTLNKAKDPLTNDYVPGQQWIANLYDQDYWNSPNVVCHNSGSSGTSGSGSGGSLSEANANYGY